MLASECTVSQCLKRKKKCVLFYLQGKKDARKKKKKVDMCFCVARVGQVTQVNGPFKMATTLRTDQSNLSNTVQLFTNEKDFSPYENCKKLPLFWPICSEKKS